ncbi:MAG: hypothetical protein GAK41_00248 [Burkholderia gladioli]|nr:MAG: hypothetical protein GAK41_00248 [Burkholderia gladioli]
MKWVLTAVLCAAVSGCGVAAAPCRVASTGLKMVPLVGHVAVAPTDGCAVVIDPCYVRRPVRCRRAANTENA